MHLGGKKDLKFQPSKSTLIHQILKIEICGALVYFIENKFWKVIFVKNFPKKYFFY